MSTRKPGQRLGLTGYCQALKALHAAGSAGMTYRDMCRAIDVNTTTTYRLLGWLHALGMVHVGHWTTDKDSGIRQWVRPRFVMNIGAATHDAPHPGLLNGQHGSIVCRPSGRVPVNLTSFAAAVRALMAGPCSINDVAAESGLSRKATSAVVHSLHSTHALLHICDHQLRDNGGHGYPLYIWGPGLRDKPKPRPRDKAALNRLHQARRYQRKRLMRQSSACGQMVAAVTGADFTKTRRSAGRTISSTPGR